MKLPSLLSHKKPEREVFLSLLLYPDAVDAAVWEIGAKGGAVILGAVTQELVHDSWEERTEATDKCVSTLEELAKTTNITKVILGLPSHYLTRDGDILKESRPHIKKLTEALGLEAIGFVSIYQALIHKYKRDEGVPPSVILLGLMDGTATVSLYRVGSLVGQVTIPLHEGIGEHLEEALASFSDSSILPSRILLYGTRPAVLEHFKRELLRYPWSKKANFIHVPKVEILGGDGAAVAVSFAGAAELTNEMGEEAEELTLPEEQEDTEEVIEKPKKDQEPIDTETDEEEDPLDREGEEDEDEEITDEDIEEEAEAEEEENEAEVLQSEEEMESRANVIAVDPSALGFHPQHDNEYDDETPALKSTERRTLHTQRVSRRLSHPFSQVKQRVGSFFTRKDQSEISSDENTPRRNRLPIFVIPVVLLLIGLIAAYVLGTQILPRASVVISLTPQTIKKSQTVIVDSTVAAVMPDQTVVPGIKEEQTSSGSKSVPATGKKQIGDAATGSVSIFNKSTVARTFKKGTVLSSGSVDFTLDNETSIDAAVESLSQGSITYGKGTAKVTAKQIGTSGNIAAGQEFSIAGVSASIAIARNEAAFTGGTSKSVTVVARADQDAIVKQLTTELTDKLQDDFSSSSQSEVLIPGTIKTQVTDKTFSQEVGQEANQVDGKVTMQITGTGYKKEDLVSLMETLLKKDVPSGFQLEAGKTDVTMGNPVVAKDGTIKIEASASGQAVALIPVSQLLGEIAGKTVEEATAIIKKLSGVNDVQITVGSSIFKDRLPVRAQNITISSKEQ